MTIKTTIAILLIAFSHQLHAVTVEDTNQSKVIAPFGLPSRQPPTGAGIKIIDFKLGLSAQQVCGYTDWTTAQLHLPKQLLSKTYWKHVGKQVVNQAKQTVMNLSGALPSMLACNVSSTFCHVMNQAEVMAAFSSDLDWKSCEMLEGVANQSLFQADELRRCVQTQLNTNRLTPGQAREVCLQKDRPSTEPLTPSEKIANTASKTGGDNGFDMQEFINDVFPTRIQSSSGSYTYLTEGGHRYSRRTSTKTFMTKLFPGVSISGGSTVVKGGTFQPNIDEEVAQETAKTKSAVKEILLEMRRHQVKGFAKNDIIKKSAHLWKDKSKWISEKIPHPIYRPTSDATDPSFLVTPNQIAMLLPLLESGENGQELEQVLDRLGQTSSFVKVMDKLSDIYINSLRKRLDPKYSNALAQKNIELALQNTKALMAVVKEKRDAEDNVYRVQTQISNYVQEFQKDQLQTVTPMNKKDLRTAPTGKFKIPGTF